MTQDGYISVAEEDVWHLIGLVFARVSSSCTYAHLPDYQTPQMFKMCLKRMSPRVR